jgi:hypothetical protein
MQRTILATVLVVFLLCAAKGRTQYSSAVDTSDVASDHWDDEIEETLVSLDLLRLDQWMLRHPEADPTLIEEIQSLRSLAAEFVAKGDLVSARAFLEAGWELIQSLPSDEVEQDSGPLDIASSDNGLFQELDSPPRFSWTRELLFGSDLWRQTFDLAFATTDSGFVESSTNPYSGLRMSFGYGEWRRGWQGYALFKYSRDYVAGELDFQLRQPLGGFGSWNIGNRFESTRYRQETFGLRYLQNSSTLLVELQPVGSVQVRLEDEFRLRRYADESELYPSYSENTGRLASYVSFGGWRIGGAGQFRFRYHTAFPRNDYREWRWNASIYSSSGRGSSFFLQLQQRRRDYFNTTPRDSTFLQTYDELYGEGDWRIAFGPLWGFRVRSFGTLRTYDSFSPFTLDYVDVELRPEFVIRLTSAVNLGVGFLYGWRDYREPAHVRDTQPVQPALRSSVNFEDYRAFGPSITLEILQLENLVLNLTETYQWRRYPNSPVTSVKNFTLYSDRNINSLLLFLSWNITPDWQFNVVANLDDDRGAEVDKGNTQSTLLSVELTFGF